MSQPGIFRVRLILTKIVVHLDFLSKLRLSNSNRYFNRIIKPNEPPHLVLVQSIITWPRIKSLKPRIIEQFVTKMEIYSRITDLPSDLGYLETNDLIYPDISLQDCSSSKIKILPINQPFLEDSREENCQYPVISATTDWQLILSFLRLQRYSTVVEGSTKFLQKWVEIIESDQEDSEGDY